MFNNQRSFVDPSSRCLSSAHDNRRKPLGLDPNMLYDHNDFMPATVPSKTSNYPSIDWNSSFSSNTPAFSSNPPSASPRGHGSIGSIGSFGASVGVSPGQGKSLSQFQYHRTPQSSALSAPTLMTSQPSHFSQRSQSGLPAQTIRPTPTVQTNMSGQLSSQPEIGGMDETFIGDDEQPDLSAAQIISGLKGQIDVLITAIMMSETPSSGISKGVDAVEVAHRVMTRLENLRAENDRLADLVSGKHSSQLEATNARLVSEIDELKSELAQMRVVGPPTR